MSVPLDRLYHYLDDLNNRDILIYRFIPHGSKKLNNLQLLHPYTNVNDCDFNFVPVMVCHDQEPLNFDLHQLTPIENIPVDQVIKESMPYWPLHPVVKKFAESMPRLRASLDSPFSVYDKTLLCHSEKNSQELEKVSNEFIGVYYWSHALIARDWFRYAKLDPNLSNRLEYSYDFLIHNRAWSGTREYRLKFNELLISKGLHHSSLTRFSPIDEIHYTDHVFKNSDLQISISDLEMHLPQNTADSYASADYVNDDYNQCGIEVVLETLFDDQRHHLTEKTLRPIACGKPFILAATTGSLTYLRDYGFETYNGLIDETYDTIVDPLERLQAIINEMQRIHMLPQDEKIKLWQQLNLIAQRNKTLFFSDQWQQQIVNEYVVNRDLAIAENKKFKQGKWRREFNAILASIGIKTPLTRQVDD
jgi:hypothetical protein